MWTASIGVTAGLSVREGVALASPRCAESVASMVCSSRAGNSIGARVVDTPVCGCGALCADEHATSMTKNFFTHSVTRELRNRFLFTAREGNYVLSRRCFSCTVASDRGADYVESR